MVEWAEVSFILFYWNNLNLTTLAPIALHFRFIFIAPYDLYVSLNWYIHSKYLWTAKNSLTQKSFQIQLSKEGVNGVGINENGLKSYRIGLKEYRTIYKICEELFIHWSEYCRRERRRRKEKVRKKGSKFIRENAK